MENFNELTSLVKDFKYELLYGDLNNCGNILDASWKIKKGFTKNVSNSSIDEIYSIGKRAGALGGKVLGAGGGGRRAASARHREANADGRGAADADDRKGAGHASTGDPHVCRPEENL